MAFTIGELILTLQAYFIRDWFTLQVINFPKVPFVHHFIEKIDSFLTQYTSSTVIYVEFLFKIFDEMEIKRNFLKPEQIIAHAPMLVLLGLYFLVPESTRWLLAKGQISEAKRGLLQRAKINKCAPIPEELLEGTVTEAKDTQQV